MYSHEITFDTAETGYWEAQAKFSDTVMHDAGAAAVGTSFCTIAFTRTVPVGLREDKATITLALSKDAGGGLWSVIPPGEKAAAETALDTWWASQKTEAANQFALNEYRWHDWLLSEPQLGPADRVTARNIAGTTGATSRLPDQCALAVTLTTASRRHWGRVYLPGVGFNRLDNTTGRWSNSAVDAATLNFHTLVTNLLAGSVQPVVASRLHRGILDVATVQSDDVVDIQRRRRAKQANYHKIYSA